MGSVLSIKRELIAILSVSDIKVLMITLNEAQDLAQRESDLKRRIEFSRRILITSIRPSGRVNVAACRKVH